MFENHRKSLIASEASYVYILSGQKLIKMPKMVHLGEFWKPEACGQTVLPDRSVLWQNWWKMPKFKCDILSNFQTMWPVQNEMETYLDSIMRFPFILSSLPIELLNVSWTQIIAIIKKKQIFIFANLFCHWGFKVEPLSFYELWNLFTQHLGNLPDSKNQRKKHVWRRASSSHLKVEIPRHR